MRRVLLAGAVLAAAGLAFFIALLSPPHRGEPFEADFVILPGESLPEIAGTLESMGLVRNAHAFLILAVVRGKADRIQAGPYRASSSEWAWVILDRLAAGDVLDTTVTVVEGSWMAEVAEQVAPFLEGGADSFLAAAGDSLFLRSLGVEGAGAEGYLFPDTYRLIPGSPARALVRQMVRNFFRKWEGELAGRAAEKGVDRHQAATLASIVEAEAQVDHERSRIAAVYWNRLRAGMPLQADPTVAYAKGRRLPRTRHGDLETASPYNTYAQPGLPPGPIGNPGLASLRAVLWPQEGCEDLYFVARGDGTHLFAPDFEGHRRNREMVRREQGSGLR